MPISSTRRLMEQKVSLEHTTHPYSASLLSERRPSSSIHTTRASPPSIPIKAGRRAGHKCLGLGMLSAIREQRIQRRALAWCSWAQARRAEGSAAPRRLAPERLADCRTCNSGKRGNVRMRRRLDLGVAGSDAGFRADYRAGKPRKTDRQTRGASMVLLQTGPAEDWPVLGGNGCAFMTRNIRCLASFVVA